MMHSVRRLVLQGALGFYWVFIACVTIAAPHVLTSSCFIVPPTSSLLSLPSSFPLLPLPFPPPLLSSPLLASVGSMM